MAWYREMFDFLGENYFGVFHKDKIRKAKKDVEFLMEVLELQKDMRILDLCCGIGRHSIPLAKRGMDVVGLDFSEKFLAIAEEEALKHEVDILFLKGDMRRLPFNNEFDAVINMWTSFGYLENDNEHQRVLQEVANSLRPGGKFLLDILNRDWVVRNFEPGEEQREFNGNLELNHYQFNSLTGRDEMRTVYIVDGQEKEFIHSCRLYTYQEIQWMFNGAGLNITKVYGGYDQRPFSLESQRMIVVGEK